MTNEERCEQLTEALTQIAVVASQLAVKLMRLSNGYEEAMRARQAEGTSRRKNAYARGC